MDHAFRNLDIHQIECEKSGRSARPKTGISPKISAATPTTGRSGRWWPSTLTRSSSVVARRRPGDRRLLLVSLRSPLAHPDREPHPTLDGRPRLLPASRRRPVAKQHRLGVVIKEYDNN